MTIQEVLTELETLGTAQNRKVYKRHGISEPLYGVSYANLNKLKKKIKVNHELAQQLWATGNHDARVLATKIANAKQMTEEEIEAWASELDDYVLTGALTDVVGKSPVIIQKMEEWTASDEEWRGRAGWLLLANLAMRKKNPLPDAYFEPYLTIIEQDIHERKNRVRDAMNSALIAIGMRNDDSEQKTLAIAKRIGKVEVDHGETSCKTPDAAAYIKKARARQKKRGA